MKKIVISSILLIIMTIGLIAPAFATTASSSMPTKFQGEVKRMDLSMGNSQAMAAPSIAPKVSIVYPADKAVLAQGTYTVQVSARAKYGVAKVEVKIDGAGSISWTEITNNLVGTYYTFVWTVSSDGPASITARVTDTKAKTATDTNTVTIGQPAPSKWAVVIGIADYEGRANDLWNPDADAKDMQSVLLANGYASDHIKILLNRQATAQAIINAIDWLAANEKAGDEVVFFYSGHGSNIADSAAWDSDTEFDGFDEMIVSYDAYGITDGLLKQEFAAIESTKFALMFGSCNSGGMFDDVNDLQGTGRIIASACKADQLGWDYQLLGNTLWGYYFIDQGLLRNNANSIETAHTYASPLVIAQQADSEPQIYDNFPGEFTL
jgi:metacaspase-1